MNKINTILAVFAILASITAAGAVDIPAQPDMTVEEIETGIEEALASGGHGVFYEMLEYAFDSGANFALEGRTDEAIQVVRIMLEAEPALWSYLSTDEGYSSLTDNAEFQEILADSERTVIEQNITVPLGSPAPDFELEDVNGATYKLSDFLGKAVLLNVWATWCPPCQSEIPDLIEIQDEYGGNDFAILSIAVDEDEEGKTALETVSEYASDVGINYPVLMDDGVAAQSYIAKAGGIPETYIIDKEGNVAYFIYGGAGKAAFVSAIDPVIK